MRLKRRRRGQAQQSSRFHPSTWKRIAFLPLLCLIVAFKILSSNGYISVDYHDLAAGKEILKQKADSSEHVENSNIGFQPQNPRPSNKACIATLTTNSSQDTTNLCQALYSLQHLPDSDLAENRRATVVVFNEGLSEEQKTNLTQCTGGNRTISFPSLQYSFQDFFPSGFDPDNEPARFQKRSRWGYYQMIRFWITFVWEHPALEPYDTMMRLDTDACWKASPTGSGQEPDLQLPGLPSQLLYYANEERLEYRPVAAGFGKFVHGYVQKHNIAVKNPELFANIPVDESGDVPLFYNNFEVSRIAFFQRPEVVRFHRAITEEVFGVFRVRWGDAIARYAVIAMFASPDEIYRPGTRPNGYEHVCQEGVRIRKSMIGINHPI